MAGYSVQGWLAVGFAAPQFARNLAGDDWRARSYCQTKRLLFVARVSMPARWTRQLARPFAALPERIIAENLQQEERAAPCVTR